MAPPGPVKIGHKKDGRQRRPHRFHVSRPPPYPAAGSATDFYLKKISRYASSTNSFVAIEFNSHETMVISGGSRIFPRGGANSQKCYYFSIFCRKLHENERIWTPGGRASLAPPPLGSANGNYTITCTQGRFHSFHGCDDSYHVPVIFWQQIAT